MIPARFFQNNIWSPEFYDITRIKQKYAGRIGTLGENKRIHVRDGIQALWKKVYHIVDCTETERLICGKNGFGETVCLERAMVKPIIYNREFLPLKTINPDAYCLFPYEGAKNKDKMSINKIQELYPHTYDYMTRYEDKIKARVECNEGEYWHTFTREHNHEWFDSKKVIIPMTARDTFATYECNNGFYMDNSNVWFINIDQNDEVELKAITMIINSTVFSVFAKSGANPQSGGYFKFNKQFLTPVPFPCSKFGRGDVHTEKLSGLYDEIKRIMGVYKNASEQNYLYYESVLDAKWIEVDEICAEMYNIEPCDKEEIQKVGRALDRVTGLER